MTPRTPPPSGERPDPEALSFEHAIERLQIIVEELEAGSLSLEDSIRRYEEGVGLAQRLTQVLEEAEKRIERLVERGSGTPTTEPADLEDEAAREPGRPGARDSASRGTKPREAPEGRRTGREPTPREPSPRGGGGMEELPF